ncbi:UNVERIFIED_CONTAM: Zinc finger BED domain-containing protein RICESLEEPER 2 [Sesamum angustifolium]|uniref:Zinc finger BED domain-containing protein RICESLEEPER 2 n=1 Tax=Sesamum angustifolium TaxID=2727405 RepID=A0AAW2J6I8_9LAMI
MAISLKIAFDAYEEVDLAYKTDLSRQPFDGIPIDYDWERAKVLVKFLRHFYNLTLRISGALNARKPGSSFSRVSSSSSSSVGKSMQYTDHEATRTFYHRTRVQYVQTSGKGDRVKSELEKYLGEDVEMHRDKFDILNWWKVNTQRFPILSKWLEMYCSSGLNFASESAFSTGGRVLDAFRSSLSPKIVQALIYSQDWLRKTQTN